MHMPTLNLDLQMSTLPIDLHQVEIFHQPSEYAVVGYVLSMTFQTGKGINTDQELSPERRPIDYKQPTCFLQRSPPL